jgi:hypothetical protein
MRLDVSQQPRPIRRHPEKVALFRHPFYGPAAIRTITVYQAILHTESLARGTIPALILGAVYIALLVKLTKDRLHHLRMTGFGGTDEVIVGNPQPLP